MRKRKRSNKIVIVITGLSFGGAERVTSYLANYFVQQGREVYIISLTTGARAYFLDDAINVIEFNVDNSISPFLRYGKLIKQTRKEIQNISPSIVLGMMSYSGAIASIACLGLGIPFIVSERNDPYTSTGFTPNEKKILKFVYRKFVTKAIFQSTGAYSFYYHANDSRGLVIPNPLFIESMPPSISSIQRTNIIMSAGRLNEQKNFSLLIEAFALAKKNFPAYRLVIYGDGEEREKLIELIQRLGLEDSVLLPGVTEDIFEKYSEAEMFVLSSHYEGMPNALIEAMAMGLPCITTDYSEGRGTVVTSGVNGLVVPRDDIDLLARAMIDVIEDTALATRLGQEAALIRNDLDSTVVCRQWLDAIEETEDEFYEN